MTNYYQIAFATERAVTTASAERIAAFILDELAAGDPAIVLSECTPLAASPRNFVREDSADAVRLV